MSNDKEKRCRVSAWDEGTKAEQGEKQTGLRLMFPIGAVTF